MKRILLSLTTLPFAIGACGGEKAPVIGYNVSDFDYISWGYSDYATDMSWEGTVDFTKYSDSWAYLGFQHNDNHVEKNGYKNTVIYNFTGKEEKAKAACDKYVSTLYTSDNDAGIIPAKKFDVGYGKMHVMFITSFDAEKKIFKGLSVRGKNYYDPTTAFANPRNIENWSYHNELIDGYCEKEDVYESANTEAVTLIRDGYGDKEGSYAEKYLEERLNNTEHDGENSLFIQDSIYYGAENGQWGKIVDPKLKVDFARIYLYTHIKSSSYSLLQVINPHKTRR